MNPSSRLPIGLLAAFALAPVLVLSGCASNPGKPPRVLQPGEREVVKVNSRKKSQASGLMLEAGAIYQITADREDKWVDFWKRVSADGYESRVFRPVARWKKIPSARWFALGARIGDGEAFPVNLDWWRPAPIGGELFLFSNDLPCMYWNNFGSISVTVTRVE